jgi:hypothetical protein
LRIQIPAKTCLFRPANEDYENGGQSFTSDAINHPTHALRMPFRPIRGWHPSCCQFGGHSPRRHALSFQFGKHRRKVSGSLHCGCAVGRGQSICSIATKTDSSSLRCLQSSFSALRNHLTLMFGNRREDMQGQAVGVRIIHSHELDARVHQGSDECQIPGQAVQFRNDESSLSLAAEGQQSLAGGLEFG